MITTALLRNYRISEFIQFISNILLIIKDYGEIKLHIEQYFEVLEKSQNLLEGAYKVDKSSELTPVLSNLDLRRDNAIKCLSSVSAGYIYHYDEEYRAAGQTLVDCIDNYGDKLYSLNYEAETAVLTNIGKDLEEIPEYKNAVEKLGMNGVADELRTSNAEFEKLFVARLGEFSKNTSKSTTELMQETSLAYLELTKYIEANALLNPSDDYTNVINHVNKNIEHFNKIVENRKKSGGEGDEGEQAGENNQ